MRVLIDTCILLDYLQNRMPFADGADKILTLAVNECFEGFFTAKAISDINYILKKNTFKEEALLLTGHVWQLCEILDTAASDTFNALFSEVSDYEDAVMVETALSNRIDAIVTRNIKDFGKARIKVFTPDELLQKFSV